MNAVSCRRILTLWLRAWRDLSISRRSLHPILIERSLGIADGPANTATENIQEERTRPILRTVADRGVEHPRLAVHSRPSHWVRCTLVRLSRHSFGIERQNYV